jgi:ADP-ribose pyrophosphatase YjhB (NUDIX family)
MTVARQVAEVYAGNPNVAALAVAGSVGAGLADRFSDLELDCYWVRPPTDADRLRPVEAVGGSLLDLWDFDEDDEEWSEDYRVGQLDVTVSNFLVSSIDRFLDDVVLAASTEPVRHMRLAAIQRSRPLIGADLMASWRARADAFPDELVSALVEQALTPEALRGWAAREALVSRGDNLAVTDLLARTGQTVVRAVLALNRVYLPHRQLKWQRHLVAGLLLAPDRLAERLGSLATGRPVTALRTAETLLAETAALAQAHSGADIGAFRETLSERRAAIDPPGPVAMADARPGIARRSARAIIIDDRARLVLIKRTKPGVAPYWTTAGGGVEESDASVEAAMRREIFEELGAEAAGAVQVFLVCEQRPAGVQVQHFFVTRLVRLDPAARTGPEFLDPSRGTYDVDYVDLRGDALADINLKPAELKEFILANRVALLAEVGLVPLATASCRPIDPSQRGQLAPFV